MGSDWVIVSSLNQSLTRKIREHRHIRQIKGTVGKTEPKWQKKPKDSAPGTAGILALLGEAPWAWNLEADRKGRKEGGWANQMRVYKQVRAD